MYKLLLTFRYLRRKLIPMFAMLAVVLCTAMVIIVLSVMGGFLELVRDAGRTLMGDVAMYSGLGGFPHYEALMDEIEDLPEAEAAAPTIVAYGLLAMPGDVVEGVQVLGIDAQRQSRVTEYGDTLYWTRDRLAEHPGVAEDYGPHDPIEAALEFELPWEDTLEEDVPIVLGLEVNPYGMRLSDGTYRFSRSLMGGPAMTLTVLPPGQAGLATEPSAASVVGVNVFHSGVFEVDQSRVYVPFETLQQMMNMDEAQRVDTSVSPPRVIGTVPGRTTEIHIKAAEGYTPQQLRDAVHELYGEFIMRHEGMPPPFAMRVQTWEQRQAQFLNAVENEKRLMAFLFGIISVVAVAMIGVIFYMIVLEKTRDIGILRAIGASKAGVAAIFLSFSAVVGIIGAGLGTLLAYLIVTYINEVHAWLGDGLGGFAFTVGLPVGVIAFIAVFAGMQYATRSLFEAPRVAMLWIMPLAGLLLTLAAVAGYAVFVAAGRAAPPQASWLAISVGVPLAVAAVFFVIALAFTGTDAALGRRSLLKKAMALALCFGAVAWVFVGVMLMRIDALIETLNERLSVQIWDRSVYFFERIPSRVDWFEVGVIVVVAIVASVIGALLPAIKAGLVDPIESLRYE